MKNHIYHYFNCNCQGNKQIISNKRKNVGNQKKLRPLLLYQFQKLYMYVLGFPIGQDSATFRPQTLTKGRDRLGQPVKVQDGTRDGTRF